MYSLDNKYTSQRVSPNEYYLKCKEEITIELTSNVAKTSRGEEWADWYQRGIRVTDRNRIREHVQKRCGRWLERCAEQYGVYLITEFFSTKFEPI